MSMNLLKADLSQLTIGELRDLLIRVIDEIILRMMREAQ